MKVVAYLLDRLRMRRLAFRAREMMRLAFDPLETVYPATIVLGEGGKLRVLVLAPHADDETFGAGGIIAAHCERGDEVRVLQFSDNVASMEGDVLSPAEKQIARSREFAAAMSELGVRDTLQLGLSDAEFRTLARCPGLDEEIIGKKPMVLYLPSLFDNHRDHRMVNSWAAQELQRAANVQPLIRGYEVWTPLPSNAVFDFSERVLTKKNAIRCYSSQIRSIDYEHHILGLNAYRAMTLGTRFAEAFLQHSSRDHLRLFSQSADISPSLSL